MMADRAQDFNIRLSPNGCVSINQNMMTAAVYRIPYSALMSKRIDTDIDNSFIVYILVGKNNSKEDCIYVGKSKNGIFGRPRQHEAEDIDWKVCYIITDNSNNFLNDGVIQYLEDRISSRVDHLNSFRNITKVTNTGTVNERDERIADEFLEKACQMLYALGLYLTLDKPPLVQERLVPASSSNNNLEKPGLEILNLSGELLDMMESIQSALLSEFSKLEAVANGGQWCYLRFSMTDRKKALVYCRVIKKKGIIKAYIQGIPEDFDDPDVVPTDNDVFGSCKSLFILRNENDVSKLLSICRIAYNGLLNRR